MANWAPHASAEHNIGHHSHRPSVSKDFGASGEMRKQKRKRRRAWTVMVVMTQRRRGWPDVSGVARSAEQAAMASGHGERSERRGRRQRASKALYSCCNCFGGLSEHREDRHLVTASCLSPPVDICPACQLARPHLSCSLPLTYPVPNLPEDEAPHEPACRQSTSPHLTHP